MHLLHTVVIYGLLTALRVLGGVGPVSIPSSTTTTSAPASSVSAINIVIGSSIEACSSTQISWESFPGPTYLFIAAVSTSGNFNSLITNTAEVAIQSYIWDPVNVTAGTYYLTASASDGSLTYSGQSPKFVVSGSNSACVSTTSTVSPPPLNPSLPATSSSATSSSSSATSSPVVAITSDNHKTAIIGAVVGVAVLLFVLGLLYFFISRRQNLGVKDKHGRWGGLGGDKGGVAASLSPTRSRKSDTRHAPTESQAGILSPAASVHDHAYASYETVPGVAVLDEKDNPSEVSPSVSPIPYASSYASSHGWRRTSDPVGTDPFTPPPPLQDPRRKHRSSTSSFTFVNNRSPLVAPATVHTRRTSASAMITDHAASESSEMIPMGPTTATAAAAGAGGSTAARKTPRKPVPQYTSSVFIEANGGISAHASNDQLPLTADAAAELGSKAVGDNGKSLHYLIPDLPPPQPR